MKRGSPIAADVTAPPAQNIMAKNAQSWRRSARRRELAASTGEEGMRCNLAPAPPSGQENTA
ncbi:MAG TPA: hypothetical protein VMW19_10710 [Myxococcota bacterium]|nr:hypothetical protein [Myxococcota bacterium]